MADAQQSGRTSGTDLPVTEVIDRVQEWVDQQASHLPDFAGAYLWGGITALPMDALFPLYRDVDVHVVLTSDAHGETQEILYRGLMLEVDTAKLEAHLNAETVLADPSHGPNMATTKILADPTGILTELQQAVVADFGRRRWVQVRCDAEKSSAEQQLTAMRQISDPGGGQEAMWPVWGLLNALSGLLAVAQLKRPTTRRTLSLLGDLLDAQGRPDLHEAALTVWGSVHLSRADVQAMLEQSIAAFDRSVKVYQTPTPFGFTIRAHLRPYLTEATQEMIDEGNYREATFWIMTLVTESYLVLQNDAPEAEKPVLADQLQAMLATLGYTTVEAWAERVAVAEHLTHEVYTIADALSALHVE